MMDLIYENYFKYKDKLKEAFPTSKIEDASDEIHEERLTIEIPDEDYNKKHYYNAILNLGLALESLSFQFLLHERKGRNFIKHRMQDVGISI